jgi:hypothetical protein
LQAKQQDAPGTTPGRVQVTTANGLANATGGLEPQVGGGLVRIEECRAVDGAGLGLAPPRHGRTWRAW